jgi:hypothetical protein
VQRPLPSARQSPKGTQIVRALLVTLTAGGETQSDVEPLSAQIFSKEVHQTSERRWVLSSALAVEDEAI